MENNKLKEAKLLEAFWIGEKPGLNFSKVRLTFDKMPFEVNSPIADYIIGINIWIDEIEENTIIGRILTNESYVYLSDKSLQEGTVWYDVRDRQEKQYESQKEERVAEAKKNELSNAIEVLCNALREDTSEWSYYHSWQANIAMSFYDLAKDNDKILQWGYCDECTTNNVELLKLCNEAAKNFLNLLINK